jgi:hypothetical protein
MVPHIDTLEDGSLEGAGNKSHVKSRRLAESVLSFRWLPAVSGIFERLAGKTRAAQDINGDFRRRSIDESEV